MMQQRREGEEGLRTVVLCLVAHGFSAVNVVKIVATASSPCNAWRGWILALLLSRMSVHVLALQKSLRYK